MSELARIPPAKVYGTLDQLHKKGLVLVAPGKPRKYSPVPMDEYVDAQLKTLQDRIEDLSAAKDGLVSLFPILGDAELGERGDVTIVRGRRNVLDRLRAAFAEAQREVLLLSSSEVGRVRRMAEQAEARGVAVLRYEAPDLLDAGAREAPPRLALDGQAAEGPALVVAAFDARAAILAHLAPGDGSRRDKDVGLYAREPALVHALGAMISRHGLQGGVPARFFQDEGSSDPEQS